MPSRNASQTAPLAAANAAVFRKPRNRTARDSHAADARRVCHDDQEWVDDVESDDGRLTDADELRAYLARGHDFEDEAYCARKSRGQSKSS